jgi:hypothetical protein
MNKQYKLIKKYPNSPQLGTVVNYSEKHQIYNNNGGDFYTELPKHQVENLPEFWEEVIEKGFEVLSICYDEVIYANKIQGKDYWDGFGFWDYKENSEVIKIHSVKRLSDDVIFSIGDTTNGGIIKEFSIHGSKLQLKVDGLIFLDDFLVKKTKIFTSEDGVDIYEGDVVTWLHGDNMSIANIGKAHSSMYKHLKYFSTKEKAEEYINFRKPCLSINDIKSISVVTDNPFGLIEVLEDTLKELVKSKL